MMGTMLLVAAAVDSGAAHFSLGVLRQIVCVEELPAMMRHLSLPMPLASRASEDTCSVPFNQYRPALPMSLLDAGAFVPGFTWQASRY